MIFNNTIGHSQTEACTLTCFFGAEEWFKDMVAGGGVHADAGVLHGHHGVITRGKCTSCG